MEIRAQVRCTGAIPVTSKDDIVEGCRVFYELGQYRVLRRWKDADGWIHEDKEWIRSGIFKEMYDIDLLLKHESFSTESIAHHNFVIIPPES